MKIVDPVIALVVLHIWVHIVDPFESAAAGFQIGLLSRHLRDATANSSIAGKTFWPLSDRTKSRNNIAACGWAAIFCQADRLIVAVTGSIGYQSTGAPADLLIKA